MVTGGWWMAKSAVNHDVYFLSGQGVAILAI